MVFAEHRPRHGRPTQWVKHWTLTTLRAKRIKIGTKVTHHSRLVVFQLAELAVPRQLFRAILHRIDRLRLLFPSPK